MGRFSYETAVRVEFDDRALAHLQVVILDKLRKGESFAFSWKDDRSVGNGRSTVWVHPHATLHFKFAANRRPELNPAWLAALAYTADTAHGLYLVPEPQTSSVRDVVDAVRSAG